MNRLLFTIIFGAIALSGCTGIPEGVTPVQGFQVERYLGTWYEIVRLEHSFETGLSDVTATYQLRADGGIDVLNKGYDAEKKSWREARGRAYFLGAPDTASLKVSFFGPFYGGYHVMALDPDYQWTMIAGPTHEYFWILARTPTLPQATLDKLLTKARDSGFNLDGLITVKQDNNQAVAR